jgi:hypothetical protein
MVILLPLVWAFSPRKTQRSRRVAAILLGISTCFLVFVALMIDMLFGSSSSWIFSLGVWTLGVVTCLAVRISHGSRFALIVLGVLSVFVLVQHFFDLSPVKPYKRFFTAIQPGMTEAEMLQILHREFPSSGPFPVPVRSDFRENEISFALDPNESEWNAEAIVVHFDHGRVVRKKYWRD